MSTTMSPSSVVEGPSSSPPLATNEYLRSSFVSVPGRAAHALENVRAAVVDAGVVDGDEAALGKVDVVDDHRLAAGRLV
ncbi:hypothetical protein BRD07_02855 [Halobacteriales archaeon QS_9_68_42]|nr:MAG: hypothetical protein BRD07_02855 [Halobacteriales archaeon QS_9_68_42]